MPEASFPIHSKYQRYFSLGDFLHGPNHGAIFQWQKGGEIEFPSTELCLGCREVACTQLKLVPSRGIKESQIVTMNAEEDGL